MSPRKVGRCPPASEPETQTKSAPASSQGAGFRHRGGGADHPRAGLLELRNRGARQHAEGEAGHRRRSLQQGRDLVTVVFGKLGGDRRLAQPQRFAERPQQVLGALELGEIRVLLIEQKQIDVERRGGLRADLLHPFEDHRR